MKFLAILRGINVSGQKKVNMMELKSLFESLNLQNVKTYIQSGNVIFDSNTEEKQALKSIIEAGIEKKYEFYVPVELRSKFEMKQIINDCPFKSINIETEGTKILVTFLSNEPTPEKVIEIEAYVHPPEQLMVNGKEVYLNCPGGYGKTKLSNTFLEKKLGVVATTRNWKSVSKLYELLSE